MTCRELREWMSAEMDGEARPLERQAVRQHLTGCAECRLALSAAEALRQRLAVAECASTEAAARDEDVLLLLRREGRCGAPVRESESARIPAALRRLVACSGTGWDRRPLHAAFAAMGLSFILTWSALRWATSRPVTGDAVADRFGAAAVARRPAPDRIARWLSGTPTLAALAHLERPERPRRTRPIQRGAAEHRGRRVG